MAEKFFDNAAIQKIEKAMDAFSRRYVVVGIPKSKAKRGDDSPINNAEIGYINHMGQGRIPPRPWLIPVVEENRKKTEEFFRKSFQEAVNNPDKITEIQDKALNSVGLFMVSKVQEKIRNKIPPPLAKLTVELRKSKNSRQYNKKIQSAGGEDFTPLIDTGDFIKNIAFDIRRA